MLVAVNPAAFQLRYGGAAAASITGLYAGNLSNGGEQLRLIDARGLILRDLSFGDLPPWPIGPDGDGPSLILRDPGTNPDHTDPANWIASAIPGGLPMGVPPAQTVPRPCERSTGAPPLRAMRRFPDPLRISTATASLTFSSMLLA